MDVKRREGGGVSGSRELPVLVASTIIDVYCMCPTLV